MRVGLASPRFGRLAWFRGALASFDVVMPRRTLRRSIAVWPPTVVGSLLRIPFRLMLATAPMTSALRWEATLRHLLCSWLLTYEGSWAMLSSRPVQKRPVKGYIHLEAHIQTPMSPTGLACGLSSAQQLCSPIRLVPPWHLNAVSGCA